MTEIMNKYTREEVSKYDGCNGSRVWIIIKDNVIDVTDQLDQHPGGREAIMEFAGKDATKAFNNIGHSLEAQGYMKGAKIGELIEVDKAGDKGNKNAAASATQGKSQETSSESRSFLSIISCGICS